MSKISTIILFVFLNSCSCEKQVKMAENQATNPPEILIYIENKTQFFRNYITQEKIRELKFVNDAQFLEKNKRFTFNPEFLKREIKKVYPNKNDFGIAYIDVEAPYLDYLINEPEDSEKFKKSLHLFLDILKFVKNERPNVKWGYYYIPFTSYWDRNDAFYAKHSKIKQIIENSDVLFPSIYIFYNYVNFDFENVDYIKENTIQAIKIGKEYNKKVYPFVMSRYHPSNGKIGNEKIENANFETYINTINEAKYKNTKVDGVVLWNCDYYAFNINEPKIHQEFKNSQQTFDDYYDQYVISLLEIMKKSQNKYNPKSKL